METLQDKIQEAALVLHANVAMFYEKGNKAAGARARKASLELEKLCRQFRKESVAAGKADK